MLSELCLLGPLVLRHELGHSIIDVGEEYDGGFAYFGANASPNTTEAGFKWSHWLTHAHSSPLEVHLPRIERAIMPIHAYPWTLLNHTTPYAAHFISSGTYSRHLLRLSLSGLPSKSHLKITLDGVDIEWIPKDDIGVDRWHYDIPHAWALGPGEHELIFALGEDGDDKIAQLCHFEVIEYGNETEFNATPGVISAFPTILSRHERGSRLIHALGSPVDETWISFARDLVPSTPLDHFTSGHNETTYRPTNEECTMRMVTSPNFCSPCLESLWLHLLARVDLIDGLDITTSVLSQTSWLAPVSWGEEVHRNKFGRSASTTSMRASLRLVPFGHLRKSHYEAQTAPVSPPLAGLSLFEPIYVPSPATEYYKITWYRGDEHLQQFDNVLEIQVEDWDKHGDPGRWRVDVRLETKDVRRDPDSRLISHRIF